MKDIKQTSRKDETCGTCGLFRRDTVNPVGGIGHCSENPEKINTDGFIVPILKYPGQMSCEKWEEISQEMKGNAIINVQL